MLVAAGGENVFADIKRESVQATTELILTRKPDVILEIRGSSHESASRSRDMTAWQALPSVPAVRNDGLRLIVDSRMVGTGPPRGRSGRAAREGAASGQVPVAFGLEYDVLFPQQEDR